NDNIVEADEFFTVTLTNATGGAVLVPGSTTATAWIIDDDLASGKADFAAASYSTNESAGVAQIAVVRLGATRANYPWMSPSTPAPPPRAWTSPAAPRTSPGWTATSTPRSSTCRS